MDAIKGLTTLRKFGQRMSNDSECLNLNHELWEFRHDYTTTIPTMAIFSVFYVIIILCGCIGNTCVILAITRNKSLQTVPNLFILSLSCSDIVVCCISATITPITAFKKEWIFGFTLCRIAPFIAGISLCFSTFTLTAISIDRYMLIRFPMKKPLTHLQASCVIGMICIMAAAISSPIIFRQTLGKFDNFCGEYCTEDWNEKEDQRKAYGAVLLGLQLVIPLTIIIISYTAISLRIGQSMLLKGAKQQGNDNWDAQLTDQQRMAVKRKQRTNRMLIAMVVAFTASWIWSVSFNVLRDYDYLPNMIKEQEYLFGIATHCMAMTSTVWNPLLYAMLNLQLRAAFIDLLPMSLRGYIAEKSQLKGTDQTLLTPNKYGATSHHVQEQQSMAIRFPTRIACSNITSTVISNNGIVKSLSYDRNISHISSISSRKPSGIRVLVQRMSATAEDEQCLIEDSPDSPNHLEPFLISPPRRKSAIYIREVSPYLDGNYDCNSVIVRTSSF